MCNEAAVLECIQARIGAINASFDFGAKPKPETRKDGDLRADIERDLKVGGGKGKAAKNKAWKIRHLWEIGWADPFPDEHTGLDKMVELDKDRPVYPEQRYETPFGSPLLMFSPTDIVLLKMMKACISCGDPEDLWIHT